MEAFDEALEATGFAPEQVWGERIEDRGSQITFSALGQQAPIHAKEAWDPDFAKRTRIQADLRQRLPGLSINMGGATSIDITREGIDKAYGLKRLSEQTGVALDEMIFFGDAIFPGGNDYPAKHLGLDDWKTWLADAQTSNNSRAVQELAPQLARGGPAPFRPTFTVAERKVLKKGQGIYKSLCFTCHGTDGRGAPVPDGKKGEKLAASFINNRTILGHPDMSINVVLVYVGFMHMI